MYYMLSKILLVQLLYISYFLCYHTKIKIQLFLVDILSLLLVRPKIFINISSDVFHCHAPGKHLLECRSQSPAMISCDVLTCSIHGVQQTHLILWSMIYIYAPKLWLVKWSIQIVLQLEVICQFSRHYKQCQCQIFMENTCLYTHFS